jgi:hypothetical protein
MTVVAQVQIAAQQYQVAKQTSERARTLADISGRISVFRKEKWRKTMSGKLRKIAVEEAFSIPEIADLLIDIGKSPTLSLDKTFFDPVFRQGLRLHKRPVREDLLDVETHRLAEMDRLGVDMQILSLSSPGVQMFDADTACELAELANDRLADIVRRRPDRFGGLACFAPHAPKRAAREIERAIGTLKLNGLIVNSHTNNEYLDDPKFFPSWKRPRRMMRRFIFTRALLPTCCQARCATMASSRPCGDTGWRSAPTS